MLMLEWTGYVANSKTQPPNAILGMQLLIGPIPAACLLVGIFLAFLYPLNRARHAEVRAKLAEHQAEQKD
jgi:GPH family glycoside/pentoside/hexuronide:cation symporter